MPLIFIVDDDDSVRSVVVAVTRETVPTATIFETASSEAVLEKIRSSPTADLLITDCEMPGMDGPTLVRTLRSKKYSLPIIMVSGSHEAEDLGSNAGIDRFVSKVRVCAELPAAIQTVLSGLAVTA